MKTKNIAGSRERCWHIEASGCIVNIRQNLLGTNGLVTSVEIIPDGYDGDKWGLLDFPEKSAINIRVGEIKP